MIDIDTIIDWGFYLTMGLMGLMVGAFLIFVPIAIYQEANAETFDLRKDQWACTRSHTETITTLLPVGKVLIPSTTTHTVCDQWSRK